jgi:hypothetical protein
METVAFLGLLAVAFLVYKVVVTLRYRAKVLGVIVNDFIYDPKVPGVQGKNFLTACSLARSLDGNHYDAAFMFMISQLDMLNIGDPSSRNFVYDKIALMHDVKNRSTMGAEILDRFMVTTYEREGESNGEWLKRMI